MDVVEIQKHKSISENLKQLLDIVTGEDLDTIRVIYNKSKDLLNKHNLENLTVSDATAKEKGKISAALKIRVNTYFKKTDFYKSIREGIDNSPYECKACIAIYSSDSYDECNHVWDDCKGCDDLSKSRDIYYKQLRLLNTESAKACNETEIPEHIFNAKILLGRRNENSFEMTPLEQELNEYLLSAMFSAFMEQNEQLINKYL